jgi:hypothetical protein
MSFCSPGAINKKYCYSMQSLKLIALAYNFLKSSDKIVIVNDADKLYLNIKEKFDKYMKINDKNHWAWLDIIRLINKNKNTKITKAMKTIEISELKPSQPIEWVSNKTEWLSNFDIEKVLIQYEKDETFNYKFHGVFTIDFGLKNKDKKVENLIEDWSKNSIFLIERFDNFILELKNEQNPDLSMFVVALNRIKPLVN